MKPHRTFYCLFTDNKKRNVPKRWSKRGQRSGKSYMILNHQINCQDRRTVVSWLWQLCQCSTETQSDDSSVLILHTCQDHWRWDSSLSRGAWESCHCARDVIPWSQKDKAHPAPEQKMMPNLVGNKLPTAFSPEETTMCLYCLSCLTGGPKRERFYIVGRIRKQANRIWEAIFFAINPLSKL